MQFKLGLIINPVAGVGGSVGLKGSDGVIEKALALGAEPKSHKRAQAALDVILPYKEKLIVYTVSGDMGENLAKEMGFENQTVLQVNDSTSASDTEAAVAKLIEQGVDLILFAGGDGTARNVCSAVTDNTTVLGIPAGCKIHSGVYAITPKAAGRVVEMLINGELVTLSDADVMDIDETAFREGVVKAKRYGEMQVPSELRYVQAVKSGGKENR